MIEQLSMVDLSMQEYLSVEKIKEILIKDFGYSAEDIQYCNGIMGVPITFLDKYNPKQFQIIGLAPERLNENESCLQTKRYINAIQHKKDGTTCCGNKVNDGPTILHEIPSKFPYYTSETVPNKYIEVLYARVLIYRKG